MKINQEILKWEYTDKYYGFTNHSLVSGCEAFIECALPWIQSPRADCNSSTSRHKVSFLVFIIFCFCSVVTCVTERIREMNAMVINFMNEWMLIWVRAFITLCLTYLQVSSVMGVKVLVFSPHLLLFCYFLSVLTTWNWKKAHLIYYCSINNTVIP